VNHSDVRNHLADYLEGDLELGKRALIDAHLDECGDCSGDLAEMQSTIALLRSLPEPEVPQDFVPNVMRRIRNGEGQRGWLDGVRSALEWMMSPPFLYPASVAMIFAGVLMATGRVQVTLSPQSISLPNGQVVQLVPAPSGTAVSQLAKRKSIGQSNQQLALGPLTQSRREERRLLAAAPSANREAGSPHAPAPLVLQGQRAGSQFMLSSRLRTRNPNAGAPQSPQPPWADLDRAQSATLGRSGFAQVHSVEPPRVDASSSGIAAERLPTPDEWLELVRLNPTSFARKLARLTLAEQELWVENLARRASERGELDEVITALRDSGSERARLLAGDFSAAGARITTGGLSGDAAPSNGDAVEHSSGAR
jgi:hypothetical protein